MRNREAHHERYFFATLAIKTHKRERETEIHTRARAVYLFLTGLCGDHVFLICAYAPEPCTNHLQSMLEAYLMTPGTQ